MPTKARAAATTGPAQAREDIISPQALSSLSAGAVSAMSAVGAAVLKRHKHAMDQKPEWFWHIFAKCEAKAARIAEQAARARSGVRRCGIHRDLCQEPAEADDCRAKRSRERSKNKLSLRASPRAVYGDRPLFVGSTSKLRSSSIRRARSIAFALNTFIAWPR
jgi:hypothetical protein